MQHAPLSRTTPHSPKGSLTSVISLHGTATRQSGLLFCTVSSMRVVYPEKRACSFRRSLVPYNARRRLWISATSRVQQSYSYEPSKVPGRTSSRTSSRFRHAATTAPHRVVGSWLPGWHETATVLRQAVLFHLVRVASSALFRIFFSLSLNSASAPRPLSVIKSLQ